MLIRNVTSKYDLEQKKKQLSDYLGLQIQNEEIRAQRQADFKNPNKPPPVPPQFKSANEIQLDSLAQQKEVIENLKSIGIEPLIANQFSQDLLQFEGGITNLTKFNRLFPQLKKQITDKINPAYANTDDLKNLWEKFNTKVENTLTYSGPNPTNIFGNNVINQSSTIIATKEDYERLKYLLMKIGSKPPLDNSLIYLDKNHYDNVEESVLNFEQYKEILLLPQLQQNEFIDDLNTLIRNYNFPTKNQIDEIYKIIEMNYNANRYNDLVFNIKRLNKLIGAIKQTGIKASLKLKNELKKTVENTEQQPPLEPNLPKGRGRPKKTTSSQLTQEQKQQQDLINAQMEQMTSQGILSDVVEPKKKGRPKGSTNKQKKIPLEEQTLTMPAGGGGPSKVSNTLQKIQEQDKKTHKEIKKANQIGDKFNSLKAELETRLDNLAYDSTNQSDKDYIMEIIKIIRSLIKNDITSKIISNLLIDFDNGVSKKQIIDNLEVYFPQTKRIKKTSMIILLTNQLTKINDDIANINLKFGKEKI